MALPTDGNENTGPSGHPDLTGIAGEMRAEWRAEQESAAADAAAHWRHGRSLADWLCERMHAGDRIAATVATQTFTGIVDEVGDDLCALRGSAGRIEIHLCTGIPVAFEVVEHATAGGVRAVMRRGFRDALVARDGRVDSSVGTLARPDGIKGTVLVGRDFVAIATRAGTEAVVPIAHVAWVAPARA